MKFPTPIPGPTKANVFGSSSAARFRLIFEEERQYAPCSQVREREDPLPYAVRLIAVPWF